MIQAFIVSAILLIIGVLILGFRVFFIRNGSFPNTHIGGIKALKDQGVSCATSQDRDAQLPQNKSNINKLINDITNKY